MHVAKVLTRTLKFSSPIQLREKATVLIKVDNEESFLTFLVADFMRNLGFSAFALLRYQFLQIFWELLWVTFIPFSNLIEHSFDNNQVIRWPSNKREKRSMLLQTSRSSLLYHLSWKHCFEQKRILISFSFINRFND